VIRIIRENANNKQRNNDEYPIAVVDYEKGQNNGG
jgi:hypothetical protein